MEENLNLETILENSIVENTINDIPIIEEKENTSRKMVRRYLLTINNPEETDEEMLIYIRNLEHIKYAMFQREKGHETGTEHFQMFLIFSIGKRFNTIKNYFPKAHFEECRGSNVQCRDYCSKSDTRVSGPYEIGELTEQKKKVDEQTFIELINAGVSDMELQKLSLSLYLKHLKNLDTIRNTKIACDYKKTNRENIIVTYIYGTSGVGKTYGIIEKYGNGSFFRITDYERDPWQNYLDEKVVVFDEFRSQFGIVQMLNYLDIYPVSLSARFSNKLACYDKVFIITNVPPAVQYAKYKTEEPETYKAFNRRIHHVIYLTKDKCEVQKTRDIDELKSILPECYLNKLDTTKIQKIDQLEIIQNFTPVDDEELVF